MKTRLWYLAHWAFLPLHRLGFSRPMGWAHVNWLRSHCRDIERKFAGAKQP